MSEPREEARKALARVKVAVGSAMGMKSLDGYRYALRDIDKMLDAAVATLARTPEPQPSLSVKECAKEIQDQFAHLARMAGPDKWTDQSGWLAPIISRVRVVESPPSLSVREAAEQCAMYVSAKHFDRNKTQAIFEFIISRVAEPQGEPNELRSSWLMAQISPAPPAPARDEEPR